MKKILTIFVSISALSLVAIGIFAAMHSTLFTVNQVQFHVEGFEDRKHESPVDGEEIQKISGITLGKESLMNLDLDEVERKVIQHPWVEEVRIRKDLPSTVDLTVKIRTPIAVAQRETGILSYVGKDGKIFGTLRTNVISDLPIYSTEVTKELKKIETANRFLEVWSESPVRNYASVDSIDWNERQGYRILIHYGPESKRWLARPLIEMGQNIDAQISSQMNQIAKVIEYLSRHDIIAKRILVANDKKIVVKTARGS